MIANFHWLRGDKNPYDPDETSTNPLKFQSQYGLESATYLSHELTINNKIKALYGFRASSLSNFGPYNVYIYALGQSLSDNSIVDTVRYGKGEVLFNDFNLEPRVSLNFQFHPKGTIKLAYNRSVQYIHLLSNTVTPSPTDTWKLSDQYVKPRKSDHYSIGCYSNFQDNLWETFIETYYKEISRIINVVWLAFSIYPLLSGC